MPTRVRSHAKINLGLAIGPPREDGFHALATIYQTLALHDWVEVTATAAATGGIRITCSDGRVPCDARNTCWRAAELALDRLNLTAQVHIHIEKKLPMQGGLGAGSANAAAALLGLERELRRPLRGSDRLAIAAETGSDVPLFLIGGTVLGLGRGEENVLRLRYFSIKTSGDPHAGRHAPQRGTSARLGAGGDRSRP